MGVGAEIAETAGAARVEKEQPPKSGTREYIESLLVTVVLALFGTTFVVQAFKIPSQSMEPTLLVGDHLLVNKFIFEGRGAWYERLLPYRDIRRGDVIVFKFPYDDHPFYVKRVIGLPGDRIRIRNQQVSVNGVRLSEPYAVHHPSAPDSFGDYFPPKGHEFLYASLRPEWAQEIDKYVRDGELVVPPNHYFAMGDNRDNSLDSRYWGFVDRDAIMGRPVLVYWSVVATSEDYKDRSLLGGLEAFGRMLTHFPTRIRWDRMLHEVH